MLAAELEQRRKIRRDDVQLVRTTLAELGGPEPQLASRQRTPAQRTPARRPGKKAIAREARRLTADERWRARFLEDCQRRGWDSAPEYKCIPRDVWRMSWQIVSDHTGAAGRSWLRWARTRFGGWPLGALRAAAFEPQPDGTCTIDWSDTRARRIVALGLLLLRSAQRMTRRRALGGRSARWGMCVRGIPRAALAAALAFPWSRERPPSVGTIGNRSERWTGYLAALEDSGFLYRAQLPAASVEPWEIGESGHVINRYWLACASPGANANFRNGAWVFGAQTIDGEWLDAHELGWRLCDETIVRAFRGAQRRLLGLLVGLAQLCGTQDPPD
jgi:hypothetical protein